MPTLNQIRLFSSALILALIFSAMFTVVAFADDGTPPTDPVPAEETTPEESIAVDSSSDLPAADVPVPDSEDLSQDTIEDSAPAVEGTTEPLISDPSTLLTDLPEGTEIVVVNDQGEAVSLASTEAAEILATSDPIWCPATVATPTPGMNGCTLSFTTFGGGGSLLAALTALDPAMDGVIWIEKGYDSGVDDPGENFTLDGTTFTNMDQYKLTVKGGWNGCTPTCVSTIDMNDPSEFNGYLRIINWNNDVSISDLLFTSVAGSPALQVTTTKNISLTRTDVISNTAAFGANLDNAGSGTGNVTVVSSEFSNNGSTGGLAVASNGMITLTSVIANSNTGFGASLNTNVLGKSITISSSEFNDNGKDGLTVLSLGPITASNLTASDNGQGGIFGSGAWLDNTSATTAQNVTLTGINIFLDNRDYGLEVLSEGAISASNLYASSNLNYNGAYLNNSGATTALGVTLTGANEFKENGDEGLRIQSNGAVTLSNVIASLNGIDGVDIDNSYLGSGSAAVSVTGTNVFYNNASYGITIYSLGPITLSSVTANDNTTGANLDNSFAINPQNVTVSGVNQFSDNSSSGLVVNSKGTISVSSVTASNNTVGSGLDLSNSYGFTNSLKGITISGTNVAFGNGQYGIYASSYGPISVNSLSANNNGVGGFYLYNVNAATPQAITLTGTNVAKENDVSGLVAQSKGTVAISNLTATSNGIATSSGWGALINNCQWNGSICTGVGNVTLTGTNVFSSSYSAGIVVDSKGNISLANVTASSIVNGLGADLDNCQYDGSVCQGIGNVTLSGTNVFNSNYKTGMLVWSGGTITASNLTANSNGLGFGSGNGVDFENLYASTAKSVTLTGTNKFENNQNEGLWINSKGSVVISNLTSNGTVVGKGAYIYNLWATSSQNVTLTGTNQFDGNDDHGLFIVSLGAISLNNVTANGNGAGESWSGVYLRNQSASAPQNVTITGTNSFNSNTINGIDVLSKGVISLSNATALTNGNHGAILVNTQGLTTSAKGVTLTGVNNFSSNTNSGLYIESYGPINIASVSALSNNYGANLSNNAATGAPQNVNITGTNNFSINAVDGLNVTTLGTITINNLTASSNGSGHGAFLQNNSTALSTLPYAVTLNGTNTFNGNDDFGLYINSKGAITINNLTASYNANFEGAWLDNTFALETAPQIVKLTGTNTMDSNGGVGLFVDSFGAISANNLMAVSSLTSSGAALDNCQWDGSECDGSGGVTLTGTNNFSFNNSVGLDIYSNGAISVSNVTSTNNTGGSGASLRNSDADLPQNVTVSGTNALNSNSNTGLYILSQGAISINSVTASSNTSFGAYLVNNYGSTASLKGVTLTGTNVFNWTVTNEGLVISSYGPITLNNVTATSNGSTGVSVTNTGASTPQKIALTGNNTFNSNATHGFVANSKGAITSATSLTANYNGVSGARLFNTIGGAVGGVTLSGTNTFMYNSADVGLFVNSVGAISLNNVNASNNGSSSFDYGAFLDNTFASSPMNVTLTGTNTFNNNYDRGLRIDSEGAVSLNSVSANYNNGMAGVHGVQIDNQATDGKPVTLTGTNSFTNNTGNGMIIWSKGAVTLNNITANYNGTAGVDIQNYSSVSAPQLVKLNGTNTFIGNVDAGLQVKSRGAITVNSLTANQNMNGGAWLDNDEVGATALSTVTLTGTHYLNENTNMGLNIKTTSMVTLSKLTADDNSSKGVEITANTGNVTLACASITSNGGVGLDIISSGLTVTLKGVIAAGNTGGDIVSAVTPIIVRTCP
jgi:hypothetical protein